VKIEAVERALLELAAKLDHPFSPRGEPGAVAMALGHRARALYRSYLDLRGLERHVASRALFRPMVETNVLLRFIRKKPETRTILWQLETRRTWIGVGQEIHDRPLPYEQQFANLPTREQLVEWRSELDMIRQQALLAGVEGVGEKGALLPSMKRQVELLDSEEAWQAYVVAYMPLGFEQHVSHGSFRDAVQYASEARTATSHRRSRSRRGSSEVGAAAASAPTSVPSAATRGGRAQSF